MGQGCAKTGDRRIVGQPETSASQTNVPEDFVEQVRQALDYLYDFAYLQSHPLAQAGWFSEKRPGETAGQCLRRQLVAAIEALNPGPGVPFRTPQARLYNLMLLHHIEAMTVQEAAHELGISRRQAHRDLRHGQETVAAMLWARRPSPNAQAPAETHLSAIETEIARLEARPRPTDVCSLLQDAMEPLQRLAAQKGICFQLEIPQGPVTISTDPVIARQVFVNALSHALGQAQPGVLRVTLNTSEQVALAFHYARQPETTHAQPVAQVVTRLAERLGWAVREGTEEGENGAIVLQMTARCPIIEIIDDNEGLVELLSDYLTGHACQVVAVTSGREGLRLAMATPPDAIILDVMMPDLDGWEFLQRLRANPQCANVPVIVCSIIDNPDLAYSLGASSFLAKPVARDDILGALRQLGVV